MNSNSCPELWIGPTPFFHPNHATHTTSLLRCIKDWISTVLVLTRVAISQERKMLWVYGVISHHIPPGHAHCPTQSHAHTFLIRLYLQSIPTELLICRSNCSHFTSWIQVSLPSTGLSVRGWSSAWEFPRNSENCLQRYTRMQTIFVFLLRTIALPILRPTIHSSMCCSLFISVAFTCPPGLHYLATSTYYGNISAYFRVTSKHFEAALTYLSTNRMMAKEATKPQTKHADRMILPSSSQ